MRYPLSVKSKSVETSGIPRDYKEALCEYVWNGFEANATTISITHTINVLGGIEEICISDNGSGICFETIQDTFGAFLASQKNALSLKIKSKVNQGKGRFAGFSFANRIKWDTVCAENGKNVQYSISVYSENKNEYEVTEKALTERSTGTTVIIGNVDQILPEQVESIVSLTPEQRKGFSDILKRTQLGNIIDTIQFIEDRYKVVEALKQVVFDYTDYANERDHVQKIVEQHYWLFGEQYNLVTADQRMQKALANYLNILYGSDAPDATLNPDQEEMRRMDIFLCGARKTEDSVGDEIQENLVIELKAPKVVLTKKVLRQIEDYMDFVRKQPQFNTQLCRWRFIAVCNNVDDDVRARYATNQTKGKKGLVFSVENYELYALTWADVFKSFELRHSFLLKKLKIDQEAIEKDISQQLGNSTGREAVNNLTALALPVSMISG